MSDSSPKKSFGIQSGTRSPFDLVRVPPHSIDAEIATLGSLLLDSGAVDKVADVLLPEDFHRFEHQLIFETILELYQKRVPIDVLAVTNRIKEKKRLDEVGGSSYLVSLVNSVPTASSVAHYAEIVHNKKSLRDLIEASYTIANLGYQEDQDIELLLDEAERTVFSISQKSLHQRFTVLKDSLEEAWGRIERLHSGEGHLRGVSTGFAGIDNILAGLQKSDLVVLAARPGLGKTTLALDIIRNISVRQNIPTALFSLEMSTSQIVDRFITAEAMVDLWKLRTGRLSESAGEFGRISDALARLSQAPIYIDDEASNNVVQMRAKARRLKAEQQLGLIVVDYLQLIRPRAALDNIVQQITEISRSLKALAKELDVPVLALSQLSRAVESRHPPIPRLSDLRDSGSIEQDADVVMFIYREEKFKEDTHRKNQADILIEKHRNGPTGKVTLAFSPEKVSFRNLEDRYEE